MAGTLTLVGLMESIAIAKALAAQHKYPLDANQELIGDRLSTPPPTLPPPSPESCFLLVSGRCANWLWEAGVQAVDAEARKLSRLH